MRATVAARDKVGFEPREPGPCEGAQGDDRNSAGGLEDLIGGTAGSSARSALLIRITGRAPDDMDKAR